MTGNLGEFRQSREFFELRVPWVSTAFLALVAAVVAGALAWAAFGEIDVIVKAPAVVRPEGNVSLVKNAVAGPLGEVRLRQGLSVHKGDVLWAIDTALEAERTTVAVQDQRNQARRATLAQYVASIQLGDAAAEDAAARARATVYFSDLARLQLAAQKAHSSLEREKALPASMTTTQKVADLATESQLADLAFQNFKAQEQVKVRDELYTLQAEHEALVQRGVELDRQGLDAVVRSPIDGTVEELRKLNPGDYLLVGEEVARVVPVGADRLKLELAVDNRDIAELRPGQAVSVRFAGLPPSQYGTLTARVSVVPADTAQTSTYLVVAEVDHPWLDSKKGSRTYLKPGMTADARILLKRKTILLFLLEKLDFVS